MHVLAGNLKENPSSSAAYLMNIGIALIASGLTAGIAMFFVASLAWPSYLGFFGPLIMSDHNAEEDKNNFKQMI